MPLCLCGEAFLFGYGNCYADNKNPFMLYRKNMGVADRMMRSGAAGLISAIIGSKKKKSMLDYILLAMSGIFMVTSMSGKCPAYSVANVDTLSDAERRARNRSEVNDMIH